MKRKLPRPGSEKALRQFFGFSQQYFAGYLSITRSQLSMVESGLRVLSGDALVKYTELVVMAYGKKGLAAQPPAAMPLLPDKYRDELIWIAEGCEIDAEKCRRELAAMRQAYQQATHGHIFCTQKLASLPDTATEETRLSLQILLGTANQQLAKNGVGPQTMLQWKMEGYISGAVRARELAGG